MSCEEYDGITILTKPSPQLPAGIDINWITHFHKDRCQCCGLKFYDHSISRRCDNHFDNDNQETNYLERGHYNCKLRRYVSYHVEMKQKEMFEGNGRYLTHIYSAVFKCSSCSGIYSISRPGMDRPARHTWGSRVRLFIKTIFGSV